MAPAANGRAAISVDQEGDRAMEKAAADKTLEQERWRRPQSHRTAPSQ
jgi:hypothetical protein